MKNKCYIYGVYDRKNKCCYVGQTIDVKTRIPAHCGSGIFENGFMFKIFRSTTKKDSTRIEGQVIRAFRRRGEAYKNKAMIREKVQTKTFKLSEECHALARVAAFDAGETLQAWLEKIVVKFLAAKKGK